jgi:hypothetical protein
VAGSAPEFPILCLPGGSSSLTFALDRLVGKAGDEAPSPGGAANQLKTVTHEALRTPVTLNRAPLAEPLERLPLPRLTMDVDRTVVS